MASGHEAVKAAVVAHIAANVGPWVTATAVDNWPPAPVLVAATEVLPVDEDKPWPCVLVSSTGLPRHRRESSLGDGAFIGDYTVTIKVGVRSGESRNYDLATVGRDRLLLAVRWLLLAHPKLSDTAFVVVRDLTETTDPVALDTKGRPVALGAVEVVVRQTETLPDPDAVEALTADVDVTAVPADENLPDPEPAPEPEPAGD